MSAGGAERRRLGHHGPVSVEVRYRCEVSQELAERAGPQVDALLCWWADRWHERTRARRRVPLAVVRWAGLGLALLGIVLTGFLIVVTPDLPRRGGRSPLFYDALMALFVIFATLFGFMERITPALAAWSRRMAARQAARFRERTRRAAPYGVDYAISAGRLEGRVEKPRQLSVTELRRVESAAFAREVACLYGDRLPRLVKRIVWLPEGADRERLREALHAAGVQVIDLPRNDGPDAPRPQ